MEGNKAKLGSNAALSLPSCVTLVKVLNPPVPQFPQLQNGSNSCYVNDWLSILNGLTLVQCLDLCLAFTEDLLICVITLVMGDLKISTNKITTII